ncbi:hypothetical protein ACHAXT_009738 [Thalassiosira profunda]
MKGTGDNARGSAKGAAEAARPPPVRRAATVDASGRIALGPGAYAVAGPNFGAAEASDRAGNAAADGNNTVVADEEVVIEGFVPEPTPEELREERIRAEVEEMKRTSVALDPSAVRIVDADEGGGEAADEESEGTANEGGEGIKRYLKRPLAAVCLTVAVLLAIALAVAFGSSGGDGSEEESNDLGQSSCTIDTVPGRYEVARSIVSEITPPAVLDDAATPQARALEWIVCNDQISSALIDARDDSNGMLPNQTWGTLDGGNAGESHVLRRYILATFYYATSEDGPWNRTLSFLSGDLHECAWHENRTGRVFPWGEFDPTGVVCTDRSLGPAARPWFVMLDDAEQRIGVLNLHIRIPNNLIGPLPPEIGFLTDLSSLAFENVKGLRGTLPSTLGNLTNLNVLVLINMGPNLGGTIPASLFSLPEIGIINILVNEGVWELPDNFEPNENSKLFSLGLRSNGLKGTLPSSLAKFKSLGRLELSDNCSMDVFGELPSLQYLNLHGNKFNGTLPESLGQAEDMTVMFMGNNRIRGLLQSSMGNLGKLELLDLSHNELEGTVPASFSRLTSLQHISLQNNLDLHGPISAFEPLQNLSSLALYGNSFSGSTKGLFSGAAERQIVADFGHNNFTGDLPDALTKYASNTSECLLIVCCL